MSGIWMVWFDGPTIVLIKRAPLRTGVRKGNRLRHGAFNPPALLLLFPSMSEDSNGPRQYEESPAHLRLKAKFGENYGCRTIYIHRDRLAL